MTQNLLDNKCHKAAILHLKVKNATVLEKTYKS